MRIATWNVNSIRQRLDHLLTWLRDCAPEIVCLQEIKCVDEAFPREAIEALTRSCVPGAAPIDLVLMDIMMPEMDGLTAMREIRKQPEWKKLPIIALTAKAMKDDHERCLSAGANDYIAKPLDVEKLMSLVRVWIPK